MKKKDVYKLAIIALAIFAMLTIIFVTTAIIQPPKRTSKAQKYDLDCVTQLNEKPLQECKR